MGKSALFTISAKITEPSTDISLKIYQPLGYNVRSPSEELGYFFLKSCLASYFFQDMFHIGKINREIGNAFACSNPDKWVDTLRETPTGLTWNKAECSYDFLVNREGETHFLLYEN